jgi:tellurite resistance protein TerC
MSTPAWGWLALGGLLALLLVFDLRVNGGARQPTLRRSLAASGGWIAVSVAFGVVLGALQGRQVGEAYFAAYMLEKSLSIDNIFVFVLLFSALGVPSIHQHRVLYYGVAGALVLRAAFITAGAALLDNFEWVFYIFGGVVLVSGVRMARSVNEVDPQRNPLLRIARCVVPITPDYEGERFFVRRSGRRLGTPLLFALVAIELSDIVFATDSIPAVFGVTRDDFVVFSSNAFAVLGLRALYFLLADAMGRFRFLREGVAALLVLIGAKMLIRPLIDISVPVTLVTIVVVVVAAIALSLWRPLRPEVPDRDACRQDSSL